MDGQSSTGNWIAVVGLMLAVPGALLAWSQLSSADEDAATPRTSLSTTAPIPNDDTDRANDDSGTSSTSTNSGSGGNGFDVSNCEITVDHIGAQIHDEPNHAARVLVSVPSGDYSPLAATEATWAGRVELWYQLDVNGRVGWLVDDTILVTAKSGGCP